MFATDFESEERSFRNRKSVTAIVVTILVHGLILLFLIFTLLHTPIPPFEDNAGGMSVNFGTDDVGTGDEQPFTYNPGTVAAQPVSAATKSEPEASTPENLLTQETEESEVTAPKTDDKPKQKPKKESIKKPAIKPVHETAIKTKTTKVEDAPPQPKADPNALFSKGAYGKPNNSKGDGTGGGQGDQGKPDGDPNSKNYLGDGHGNGNGPGNGDLNGGYNLKGRTRVALPRPTQCSAQGKVVIHIKVDKLGNVTDAKFQLQGSTTSDECNKGNAINAAYKAKFNADSNAPDVQEGTITYIYKVQ